MTDSFGMNSDPDAPGLMSAQIRLGRDFVDVARAALSGDLNGVEASRAFIGATGRETVRYWLSAAELSTAYAKDLVRLYQTAGTALLSSVQAAGSGTDHRPG
jgi:hypothetical protein